MTQYGAHLQSHSQESAKLPLGQKDEDGVRREFATEERGIRVSRLPADEAEKFTCRGQLKLVLEVEDGWQPFDLESPPNIPSHT